MLSHWKKLAILVVWLTRLCLPLSAQEISLRGRVTDPRGNGLPKASVQLIRHDSAGEGEASRQTISGPDGGFEIRAASAGELEADLTGGARVSLPSMPLSLESVQRLDWAPEGSSVLAVVQAQDGRGVQYTLAYELDVAREQGRWEVSAVQTDPDA